MEVYLLVIDSQSSFLFDVWTGFGGFDEFEIMFIFELDILLITIHTQS